MFSLHGSQQFFPVFDETDMDPDQIDQADDQSDKYEQDRNRSPEIEDDIHLLLCHRFRSLSRGTPFESNYLKHVSVSFVHTDRLEFTGIAGFSIEPALYCTIRMRNALPVRSVGYLHDLE
jgi:hypothetical protein